MSLLEGRRQTTPYEIAHKIALAEESEKLRSLGLEPVCLRSGATRVEDGLELSYFGDRYRISLPEVRFDPPDTSPQRRILILHYLNSDGRSETKPGYSNFKNLPDGMFYNGPYSGRTTGRILRAFGDNIRGLVAAAKRVGGEPWEEGDAAARFQLFPKIEAIVVAYEGDDEFPPDVNILYSNQIVNFLSLEDIAVLGGDLAGRLTKALREGS